MITCSSKILTQSLFPSLRFYFSQALVVEIESQSYVQIDPKYTTFLIGFWNRSEIILGSPFFEGMYVEFWLDNQTQIPHISIFEYSSDQLRRRKGQQIGSSFHFHCVCISHDCYCSYALIYPLLRKEAFIKLSTIYGNKCFVSVTNNKLKRLCTGD